jgi:hypothetical protein
MAEHLKSIDITDMPDVLRLAEEVRASDEPRILRRDSEDIALVVPLPSRSKRRGKRKMEADYEAFRSAAGSWKDVDTDALIADIYEDRRRSMRPPVE